jgi:phosphatidylinositol 3,5-bisphosphate 5-phosphatase
MASQVDTPNSDASHDIRGENDVQADFPDQSSHETHPDFRDFEEIGGQPGGYQNGNLTDEPKQLSLSDCVSSAPSPRTHSRAADVQNQTGSDDRLQVLNRFTLYETASRYYLVGQDISERYFKVLKIDRSSPPGLLSIFEDDILYDKKSKDELLTTIDDGNKASGGLRMKCNAWGILGFVRFTEAYYMVLITKRMHVAMIGGHYIFMIEATEVIPLTTGSTSRFQRDRNFEETKYLGIFSNIDLAKSFYFSYTYNITRTLQHNISHSREAWRHGISHPNPDFNEMFIWNYHLLDSAKEGLKAPYIWCVPIIHGFIEQECNQTLSHKKQS